MKDKLLLYGATGYTGELIVKVAAKYGLSLVLAGRNPSKVKALAAASGFGYRVFSLENIDIIASHLSDVKAVMHAAGPFAFTAAPMIEACLQTATHYLDITGEIDIFEQAAGLHQRALGLNIMLMPGTGFDVVPTDCLAKSLKEKMPDATHLEIAFGTRYGGISHGTASSMVNKLGRGGAQRIDGILVPKPLGHQCLELTVDGFRMFTMAIPWGDLSTAWRTTGIPNIVTYTLIGKNVYRLLKIQGLFNWILRKPWVRQWLQKKIDARPAGPSDEQRERAKSYLWGRVTNARGESIAGAYTAPEAYTLTAYTAVHIAQKVMNDNWKPGYQTPAGCYGQGLVFEIEGVQPLQWLG